ncbi:palmitoyl-acyl carrier protein thioesterase, chloroplastic isoform X2 [Quercus suber]|uniref:palmitoyl-acyl carrier protein thioesterase, chloroplastic isoform X2 n=1 Tax=Quercus suber TaxID=58331 RepID=UPI0032DF0AC7
MIVLNHCHSPKESTLNHLNSVGLLADGFGSTPKMHRRDLIWVAYQLQIEVDRRSSWLTLVILQMNVTTNYQVNKMVILQSFKKFMFKAMYNSHQHL